MFEENKGHVLICFEAEFESVTLISLSFSATKSALPLDLIVLLLVYSEY